MGRKFRNCADKDQSWPKEMITVAYVLESDSQAQEKIIALFKDTGIEIKFKGSEMLNILVFDLYETQAKKLLKKGMVRDQFVVRFAE